MSRQLEQKVQEQFSIYLYGRGLLYCASAGGMRTSIGTAMKMKRSGYKKGFPDIFIYEPSGQWHGMAIEVKCGSYPTEDQLRWRDWLRERGYYSVIVPGNLDYLQVIHWLEREVDVYLKGVA